MYDTPSPLANEEETPEFTVEELNDENFLRRKVRKMNKEIAKERRTLHRDLKARLAQAQKEVMSKEAGLPKHKADSNPAVLEKRRERDDCRMFLHDFEHALTLSANLETIDTFHAIRDEKIMQSSVARPEKWLGHLNKSAFSKSSTFVTIGGKVHKGMNIIKAKHSDTWRMPTGYNSDILKVRVDTEPSSRHSGSKPTPEEVRMARQNYPSSKWRCAGHLKKFGEPRVDHPKHGQPFKQRQLVRTFLEHHIAKLQKTIKKIPNYPRRNREIKEGYEYALADTLRVYHSVTGAKEKKLEKKVSSIKKRVKGKLHMLYAIESGGGGDMSFLKEIEKLEKREMDKIKGNSRRD